MTRHSWEPQVEALAGHHRLLVPDLPGHGELSGCPFTFVEAVERVRRLVSAEAGGRALVVGHSLGGLVGIEFAHKHPDQVAGVVLIGATVDYTRAPLRVLGAVNAVLLGHVYPERLLTAIQTRTLPRMMEPEYACSQIRAGFFFRGAAPAYRLMGRINCLQHLSEYRGSSLFINGEDDRINCRGEAAFLRLAQNGRALRVVGAGHAVNLQRPREVSDAVQQFAVSIGWP